MIRIDSKNQKIIDALMQCATGMNAGEVVEEFAMLDGELKLVKRKVTKRDIPPDVKAAKMLLENGGDGGLSDEELQAEKEKLLSLLKENKFD